VTVGWNALGFSLMATHEARLPFLPFAAVPLMLPALIMIFSWAALPWPYSVFGAFERTLLPSEPAKLTVGPTSAGIGLLSLGGPLVTFAVLPSGLGISILGGAGAFVPTSSLRAVTGGGWLRSSLVHTCAEVRSPIRFRSRELHDAVAAMIAGRPASP
jgi:hypothetical protein